MNGCVRAQLARLQLPWHIPHVTGASDGAGQQVGVLIVDDHDLFRAGLATMLQAEDGIEVLAQASRGKLGVQLAVELKPDVVLMDLRMPDLDGVEATRTIVERQPQARVIALTVATEDDDIAAALLAGACGYLGKDAPIGELAAAIRAAARGESWLSPRAADAMLAKLRREHVEEVTQTDGLELLSPRELEILRLVARGMENAEIASALNISPRTAKNHLSSVLSKLGMTNRVQAATYAVRHGLD
jgi:DNA-binding NarL/FixJ family response regulator